jgi:hypothetical protein
VNTDTDLQWILILARIQWTVILLLIREGYRTMDTNLQWILIGDTEQWILLILIHSGYIYWYWSGYSEQWILLLIREGYITMDTDTDLQWILIRDKEQWILIYSGYWYGIHDNGYWYSGYWPGIQNSGYWYTVDTDQGYRTVDPIPIYSGYWPGIQNSGYRDTDLILIYSGYWPGMQNSGYWCKFYATFYVLKYFKV